MTTRSSREGSFERRQSYENVTSPDTLLLSLSPGFKELERDRTRLVFFMLDFFLVIGRP
jgi:hypothetical protein